MKIIKNKDHYLFSNENGEYHLSISDYKDLGKQKAIKFVEKELLKKSKTYLSKTINFENARDLGFCSFGIKDFCKELDLNIKNTYKLSFIEEKLSNVKYLKLIFNYPSEILKLFGKNIFIKHEKAISEDADYSYHYALNVLKSRFELGEEVISEYADYSYWYALDVLKGRFELGEKAISENASYSYWYALDVLKSRFELGENAISGDAQYSKLYNEKFNVKEDL